MKGRISNIHLIIKIFGLLAHPFRYNSVLIFILYFKLTTVFRPVWFKLFLKAKTTLQLGKWKREVRKREKGSATGSKGRGREEIRESGREVGEMEEGGKKKRRN